MEFNQHRHDQPGHPNEGASEKWWHDVFTGNTDATMASLHDTGLTDADLQGVDIMQAYQNACSAPGVPAEYRGAMQNYSGGSSAEQVIQQVRYVQEVHNFNQQIVDNSTNVNNILDVDGDLSVDGDFDFNPVTAAGDRSVAGGHDATGATGDGSAASHDGNAAASGGVNLDASQTFNVDLGQPQPPILTAQAPGGLGRVLGEDGGGLSGLGGLRPDINVNTGAGDQFNVDGPVSGSQLGHFGEGASNINQSALANSPVGTHGDVFQGNTVDHGSALGNAGHDLTGHNEDFQQQLHTEGADSPIFGSQAHDQHLVEDPGHHLPAEELQHHE